MRYADHRREYTQGGLRREMLAEGPMALLTRWLDEAVAAGLSDPTAASLATIEPAGDPWQRVVLIKEVGADGLVFYTNYQSHKARDLAHCNRACLLFPWQELERQVTVQGRVVEVDAARSDQYFASRPRTSQLGAWASQQSEAINDRETLEAQYRTIEKQFSGQAITRPPHWGGFLLQPQRSEFWQGGALRMHDRFRCELDADANWQITRLQP